MNTFTNSQFPITDSSLLNRNKKSEREREIGNIDSVIDSYADLVTNTAWVAGRVVKCKFML